MLGRRGASVVVNYVSPGSKEKAQRIVVEIEAAGSKADICRADVSKMEDIPKLVEATLALSPSRKIDILIHKYTIPIIPSNLSAANCEL